MKKIFCFAIAALALAACAKEIELDPVVDPVVNPEQPSDASMVKISFTASFAKEGETKATIDMSTGDGSWNKGDAIAIHTHNGHLVTLYAEADGTTVDFSGEIDSSDSIDENAIAYYPASIAVEGYYDQVNLPTSYASAAKAAQSFLLKGVISGDDIEFKHIGSLMKISINNVPSSVTAIEFTAPNKVITGAFSLSGTPECITAGNLEEGSTTITISSSAAERSSSTSEFYLPLPTGSLSGFSIVLKAGSTTLYTKSTSKNVDLTRATISKMKAFTPEGEGSGWYLVGGFNNWSLGSLEMTEVLGLDNWVVARNVNIATQSGQDSGFKFVPSNSVWTTTYGFNEAISTLQKEYQASDGEGNIHYNNDSGTYDIFFNTNSHKFYLTSPDASVQYRTIYLMTDMELSDGTYYLHVWPHSGTGTNTIWPGIAGTIETIAGIPYYKFEMGAELTAGTYDCCFNNGNSPTRRYDFRSGKLVVPDDNSASYYLSFTSNVWDGNKGEGNDNPMTQFTDPAQPQGSSQWTVVPNPATDPKYNYTEWNSSPILIYRALRINKSTPLTFRFTNGSVNHFYYASGTVNANEDFVVTFQKDGSRSSIPTFTVGDLDGDTYCDIYLDVFNKTAKVVPLEMTTLYFNIDREVTNAYLHTWGDFSTSSFPGMEMTDHETINGKNYYKASIPISGSWDYHVNMIVSDGNHEGHWQTSDFTTADLSGAKSEYFFKVTGSTITQLSKRPEAISISIDGTFTDWANEDIASKDYSGILANFKAWSDGSRLYLYHSFDGSTLDLTKWDYMNLMIDKDNSDSTGDVSDKTWYCRGVEGDLEFYFCKDGNVLSSFDLIYYKVYANTAWSESTLTTSNINWGGTKDSNNNVKVEWSIPIADIGVSNNSVIRLGFVASSPQATNEGRNNALVVTIPAAPSAD